MATRIGIDARLIRAYGIGSYIRGLLSGLASLGAHEQFVVFARSEDRERVPAAFEFVRADIPTYSIQELPRMGRLIARAKLDLFHAPHFTVPWTRVPVVVTMYDAIPFHYKLRNPIAFAYITFMMQTAARRARRILAISHAAKRDLVEALDCDPDRITVSHIGVDDAFFQSTADRKSTEPYFLFVGRVAVHKNIDTLIDALAIARKRVPSLRVVLAGGEHDAHDAEGVVVPGFLPHAELLALYRDAVAVVMPSFMEGFGLPPLEGMAMGTPAITLHRARSRRGDGRCRAARRRPQRDRARRCDGASRRRQRAPRDARAARTRARTDLHLATLRRGDARGLSTIPAA